MTEPMEQISSILRSVVIRGHDSIAMADAIDAHLAQQAQAVDGWRAPDGFAVALFNATEAYEQTRDMFHGAHRQTHAAQVRLLRDALAELFPASPTPDKEG